MPFRGWTLIVMPLSFTDGAPNCIRYENKVRSERADFARKMRALRRFRAMVRFGYSDGMVPLGIFVPCLTVKVWTDHLTIRLHFFTFSEFNIHHSGHDRIVTWAEIQTRTLSPDFNFRLPTHAAPFPHAELYSVPGAAATPSA